MLSAHLKEKYGAPGGVVSMMYVALVAHIIILLVIAPG